MNPKHSDLRLRYGLRRKCEGFKEEQLERKSLREGMGVNRDGVAAYVGDARRSSIGFRRVLTGEWSCIEIIFSIDGYCTTITTCLMLRSFILIWRLRMSDY